MNDGRKLDLTILREYDIRGVVEETLNAEEVKMIGHAFGSMVVDQMLSELTPSVAVGYDGRLSSLEFSNSVCAGLEAAGVDVTNIGWNYYMNEFSAAIGIEQLKKLDRKI